ncbi:MAG: NERD domain-containing protein [Ardenticatenales bacterium]|nr:NERD domain-containing protein [Ardenticatenales bacterium]
MKAYTNIKKIEQKQKIGVMFSVAGVLIMAVALFISLQPESPLASWGFLGALGGLAVASIGTYHVNRWLRPPLPEPLLEKTLERFDSRHVLFNHFPIHPVPHLLLTPKGLIPIKVKRYEGKVVYDKEKARWHSEYSLRMLYQLYFKGLTAEWLGNPTEEAAQAVNDVKSWLQVHLPDLAAAIPVEAVVLFLSSKAELHHADEAPIPVTQPASLKKELQERFAEGNPLSKETYRRLRDALETGVTEMPAITQPRRSRR